MNIKDRLQAHRQAEFDIESDIADIEIMRSDAGVCGALELDNQSHPSGFVFDKMSFAVAKIVDAEAECRAKIDAHAKERKKLLAIIGRITSDDGRRIVKMRYLDGASWDRICCAVYGEREDFEENYRNYYVKMHQKNGKALFFLVKSETK